MVEIEAAREELVGLTAARVLDGKEAGNDLDEALWTEPGTQGELVLRRA
jgi:hypothetical protein